ncbi:MAG: hypothetical protein PHP82_03480 [Candidatus ainarchaeum sp.]|nr:hypothetical protein [Candidatus ainarchaeum sp.]
MINWINKKTKKMNYLDIGLIKISCIAFGITLTLIIPEIQNINVWWFIAIFVITAIKPIYTVLKKYI